MLLQFGDEPGNCFEVSIFVQDGQLEPDRRRRDDQVDLLAHG